MWRRILLALVFVAALGAAGVGFTSSAEAGHGCYRGGHGHGHGHGRGYYSAYYGPSPYYYGRPRHRAYYGPPAYYGPNYGYYSQPYYGGSGVSFSVGF